MVFAGFGPLSVKSDQAAWAQKSNAASLPDASLAPVFRFRDGGSAGGPLDQPAPALLHGASAAGPALSFLLLPTVGSTGSSSAQIHGVAKPPCRAAPCDFMSESPLGLRMRPSI
jgi:hypothetical protein